MKFIVLASGSKGNTTLFEVNGTKFLIDCGISFKQLSTRAKHADLTIDELQAVFITHEHTDHVAGLDVLLRKTNNDCYLSEKTFDSLYFKVKDNVDSTRMKFITPNEPLLLNDIKVLPFSVSHDASDAVGYVIYAEGKKIVFVTDIGYLPAKDFELLENADAYIFESNYDVTMLFTSRRPFYLKQRIDSVKGHMSNTDSAYNLTKLVGSNTKQIVLVHPSRECNTKEKALETYYEVFNDYGLNPDDYNIQVAHQDMPTDLFEI